MLSGLWTIAKNSFIEIIRQPVYALLVVMGMVLIGLSPAITMFSMVEDEKLMVDMGLATILLFGVVLAVLSVTQTISREIETQTVGAILSKPVGRLVFVMAKFLGVTMAMGVGLFLLSAVLMTTLRIGVPSAASFTMDWPAFLLQVGPALIGVAVGMYANYFYRSSFPSTALLTALPLYVVALVVLMLVGPQWEFNLFPEVMAERNMGQVAIAAVLVWFGVWVMTSVALAISTRLNVVLNVIICLMVFFVGMTSQFLFGQFAARSAAAWVALRIVPNFYVFWVGDKLMHEVPYIPWPYVGMTALYALGYCATMVALAACLFERREVI
ncbi:MAG: hypothetical protein R6X33_18035 [Candidatus Brocadiia bacterium]